MGLRLSSLKSGSGFDVAIDSLSRIFVDNICCYDTEWMKWWCLGWGGRRVILFSFADRIGRFMHKIGMVGTWNNYSMAPEYWLRFRLFNNCVGECCTRRRIKPLKSVALFKIASSRGFICIFLLYMNLITFRMSFNSDVSSVVIKILVCGLF